MKRPIEVLIDTKKMIRGNAHLAEIIVERKKDIDNENYVVLWFAGMNSHITIRQETLERLLKICKQNRKNLFYLSGRKERIYE